MDKIISKYLNRFINVIFSKSSRVHTISENTYKVFYETLEGRLNCKIFLDMGEKSYIIKTVFKSKQIISAACIKVSLLLTNLVYKTMPIFMSINFQQFH